MFYSARMNARACFATLLIACGGSGPGDPNVFDDLDGDVEVRTDSNGMHHITGESLSDVFYASGYVQARDRLFQMDQLRLQALGRRAENDPSRVDDDILMRTFDFAGMGRRNAERMLAEHPESHALMVAWTAGVNTRVREILYEGAPLPYGFSEDVLGYEPEQWRVEHTYAIGKLIVFDNANLLEREVLATIVELIAPEFNDAFGFFGPLVDAYILPPEERPTSGGGGMRRAAIRDPAPIPPGAAERIARFQRRLDGISPGASNNWAVDGRHTDNGRPLIAGDPHQALRAPSLFHMQHLRTTDGTFDVAGFGFVGTPSIQLGMNAHVVWTGTTNYPDWMDLWNVPVGESSIEFGGETVPVVRREEAFLVRGESPRTQTFVDVPGIGVILPDDLLPFDVVPPGESLLLGWTGFSASTEAHEFISMNRAASMEEFEAAVDRMTTGAFNFIAADHDSISYRSSPAVPDRGVPGTFPVPWKVLDGSDPATVWTGALLPLDRLPRSHGGIRGWLVSANNDPYGFVSDGSIEGDEFYFGVFFDPGSRAQRISDELERLIAAGDVTRAQMKTLQTDTHSVLADEMLPFLFAAADALEDDEALAAYRGRSELSDVVALLRDWDRDMDRDSRGALAFEVFAAYLSRGVLLDDLTATLYEPVYAESPVYVYKWALTALRSVPSLVEQGNHVASYEALEATAAYLASIGRDETWGDRHVLHLTSEFGGRFDLGTFPLPGGNGTVNVAQTQVVREGAVPDVLTTNGGAIYRMVAGFGASGRPEAEFAFVGGNGGDPGGEHWDDLMDDWLEGRYRPLYFEEADIEAATTARFTVTD